MESVPWKTFAHIIERHNGSAAWRTLGWTDLFRIVAFSQLTWRESLREIENYLEAKQTKLFFMGSVPRSQICPTTIRVPSRSSSSGRLGQENRQFTARNFRLHACSKILHRQNSGLQLIFAQNDDLASRLVRRIKRFFQPEAAFA